MNIQLTGVANLFPSTSGISAPTPPTPDDFSRWTNEQRVAYVEAASTDDPPFVVLGDPNGTQVLETLSADRGSVVSTAVPQSYSDALAKAASPSAGDFQSWDPQLQLAYLRQAGGSTQSLTLFSGSQAYTAAVSPNGSGVLIARQVKGLSAFWSSSTAATTAADAAATAAAGKQGTGAPQVVTPGTLSSPGAADTLTPYLSMPGATYGLNSPVNATVAGILFPVLNGDPTKVGSSILPADPQTPQEKLLVAQFKTFPDKLDAKVFGSWNSAVQLEYLRVKDPLNKGLAIGVTDPKDPLSANGVLHAFMSAPTVPQLLPQKVYVVENIQKQDIARMALADQKVLAGLPSFKTVAQSLGLLPDGIDDKTTAGIHALDSEKARNIIDAQFSTALGVIDNPTKGVPSMNNLEAAMSGADKDVFRHELAIVQGQLANSAIFSPKDIQDKINAIITRFQRAYAFGLTANSQSYAYQLYAIFSDEDHSSGGGGYLTGGSIDAYQDYFGQNEDGTFFRNYYKPTYDSATGKPIPRKGDTVESPIPGSSDPTSIRVTYGNPKPYKTRSDTGITAAITYADFTLGQQFSNTDQDAGIASGYNVFMTQEKAILAQQNRAQLLASDTSSTQNLDVPNLVFLFQLYTNLIGEATLRADTEQVNQTNAQLQTYAAMQRIINQTVASIGSSTNSFSLVGSADSGGNFTPEEKRALAIFNSLTGVPPQSPIELLQGIHRPIVSTASYTKKTGPSWSQFGTELSDTVTLLNQNSQLKMNDINAATKQKDRNFDLANSALSKMNDILTKIASSIG